MAQRQIGDHLIGVHIGGGACPALNRVDDEGRMMLAGDQFLAGGADGGGLFSWQRTELLIGVRRRPFHLGDGADEVRIFGELAPGDLEILPSAVRVDAPQRVDRNFDGAEKVLLDAHGGIGHDVSSRVLWIMKISERPSDCGSGFQKPVRTPPRAAFAPPMCCSRAAH